MIKHDEFKSALSGNLTELFVETLWPQTSKYWKYSSEKSWQIGQKPRDNSKNSSNSGVSHQSASLQAQASNSTLTPSFWPNGPSSS